VAGQVTIPDLLKKRQAGSKITMLTAADCPTARLIDGAGVDIILVGDSLGMATLGYPSTVQVTMREMLHHAKAVRRGVRRALLIGDMPFMSFNRSVDDAVRNAGRFLKEAGCDAVKVEGGQGSLESLEAVKGIHRAGIPVMGHLGLTPQTAVQVGGFKVQGRTAEAAAALVAAARQLEQAGCFGVVLECLPVEVGRAVTERLSIPTIGIGAGPDCDGQVLVTHDLLGMSPDAVPRFVRAFARLHETIARAAGDYRSAVENGGFPGAEESYRMPPEELKKLEGLLRG